jgi:PAS domain S-box-containing protein
MAENAVKIPFYKSIRGKLLQWFLWVSLIPALLIVYFSYGVAQKSIYDATIGKLTLAAVEKESALVHFLDSNIKQLRTFAIDQALQTLVADFNRLEERSLTKPSRFKEETTAFTEIELKEFQRETGFDRSLIVGKEGKVLIDTLHQMEGKDYSNDKIFRRGIQESFATFRFDAEDRPYLIVAGPIPPHAAVLEEVIGVLILTARIDSIRHLLLTEGETGEPGVTPLSTGSTSLFDSSGRIIVQPTQEKKAPYAPATLKKALARESGLIEDPDRITAYRYIEEIGDVSLLVCIVKAEAMAPIVALRNRLFLIVLAVVAAVLFLSDRASRAFLRPIQALYRGAKEIGAGRLTTRVNVKSGDEIEGLAHQFNQMADDLERWKEAVSSEKERLDVTLRSIGDGVMTADPEGKVVLMNYVAERLTGWTQEEAVGRPLAEVFHIINEKSRERCENPVQKVLQTGGVIGLANHTVLISKDGTEYNLADSGAPIRDKTGQIIGVVLVFRDVTQKLKMEEDLLRTSKLEAVGLLAGGIAHDFNNILTAIMGNLSLMKIMVQPKDPLYMRLTEAEKASQRARDLAQQLLTFAKGGAPIKKTASIKTILKEATGFALRGSNVGAAFSLPDDLWPVEIDEGQIGQVVHNLALNAQQAMPKGGTIQARAENISVTKAERGLPLSPGKYVRVSIRDAGIGIPKEHLDKIFDPYFTTKQKGSGLGLSTSYSVIKNHEGQMTVDSKLGEGSTFSFYLPASTQKMATEQTREGGALRGKGRILVMDDEEAVRQTAGEILQFLGYEVRLAREGAEAVALYQEAVRSGRSFDLVILDITVPGGMGGKEALQKLLEIDPHVKALVSSGYSNDPIMADYAKYGFKGVIAKPYQLDQMSKIVHDTITESPR